MKLLAKRPMISSTRAKTLCAIAGLNRTSMATWEVRLAIHQPWSPFLRIHPSPFQKKHALFRSRSQLLHREQRTQYAIDRFEAALNTVQELLIPQLIQSAPSSDGIVEGLREFREIAADNQGDYNSQLCFPFCVACIGLWLCQVICSISQVFLWVYRGLYVALNLSLMAN